MRYRIRDIPYLLKSKQGRKSLAAGQISRFWPAIRLYTDIYRRTILRDLRVITVIGSLGKTTTARAVATAIQGRLPDRVSNRQEMLALDLLSYSPPDGSAVLEAGIAHPGLMKGYARMLNPDIVVVTSIASEHILSFGTLENTRKEKAEMVRYLAPDKTVVLNADDPNVMWMASQTRARIITCGFSQDADIRASEPEFTDRGKMTFDLVSGQQSWKVNFSLPGSHMVFPFLAAVAVARAEGKDMGRAISGLEKMEPAKGRMEPVRIPSGALMIRDDFKSNQESVWKALEALRLIPGKRKTLVLGGIAEIGNQEGYEYYRRLGRVIAESADHAILFLHKNAFRRCRKEAVAAGLDPESIARATGNPLNAVPLLLPDLGEGDVILIKGRNDFRTSRLSLHLMGKEVECRLDRCRLAVDCEDCELLEVKFQTNPLLGPNQEQIRN